MKAKDVKQLSPEDLGTKVADLRKKLYGLRVQGVTEKIEDNSQIGKTRRDIARLLTERRARQVAQNGGGTPASEAKAPVKSKGASGKSTAGKSAAAKSGTKAATKTKAAKA